MSTNVSWADVRRAMGDPFSSQLRALINKQNMFQVQQELPKTQRARGIGRATFSRLTYQDPFTYAYSQDYRISGENAWAISLDGVNDYIDCGNQASLWSQSKTKYSFSFWIYLPVLPTTTTDAYVEHASGTTGGIFCGITGSNGRLIFQLRKSDATAIQCWSTLVTSPNTWYHVTCTYDSTLVSNNLRIYLNGIPGNSNTLTETLFPSASLTLGSTNATLSPLAYIQDFRWWTNTALSAADALDLYQGDYIGTLPDYWLKMNEGTGNPIDAVGGTLQGVLTNGATWIVAPQSPTYRYYMPPVEPDGKYLTCWIPMKAMGRYLEDLSCFRNHAYMKGKPKFCNGPDDGIFGGRPALEFNHTSGQNDFLYVPHSSKLDTSAMITGICIFSRVKFNDFTQDGGIDTTVFQKIDNASATAGFALRVGTDGKLKWYPRRGSATFDHITAANTVVLDKIYDIGCRYTLAGNTTEVHVDGVPKTDTGNQAITFPLGDATDMRIAIGDNANAGRCPCNFYDFRVYYEYLISTAEWLNLYTNKRSISTIPYRLVAAEGITQVEYKPPFTSGFSAGFTH